MKKLIEMIEKELYSIEQKGISQGNIDVTYKLVKILDGLCEVRKMKRESRHGTKIDMHMEKVCDRLEDYQYELEHMEEKHNGNYETLDRLMRSICMLIEVIEDQTEELEAKEVIRKHLHKLQEI